MRAQLFVILYAACLPLVPLAPFAGVLLWAWVSLMYPQALTYGLVSFPLAAPVAALTLACLLLSRERAMPPATATSLAMVTLALGCALAQFSADDPALGQSRWDTIWKGLLMTLATLATLRSRLRVQALVWVIALSIGFYALKGCAFVLVTGGAYRVGGAQGTIIGDNNHLAVALAMALPLLVHLALHSAHAAMRAGCWILAACAVVAALFTYSRGGALALAVALAFVWWRASRRPGAAMLAAAAAVIAFAVAPDALQERLGAIGDFAQDRSAQGRLAIWRVAAALAWERPLTGFGFHATTQPDLVHRIDADVTPRAVHNSFLEVLAEAGLPAFLGHVWLIAATAENLRRVRRDAHGQDAWRWAADLAGMLQASLAAYLVGGFFISFAFYDGWWFVAALAAAIRLQQRRGAAAAR